MSEDDPRVPAPAPAVPAADVPAPADEADEGDQPQSVAETDPDTSDDEPSVDEGDGQPPAAGDDKPRGTPRHERYQRQIERLRAENQALRTRAGSIEPDINSAVERVIGKPPKEEDFPGDFLKFSNETIAYGVEKRMVAREIREQMKSSEARNASLDQSLRAEQLADAAEEHQERVKEFRARTPDFDAVLAEANRQELKAAPAIEEMILESEHSAHLVYFLARNPKLLNDLNGMTERQAARTMGTIESRLSSPNPRTQTRAPAPLRPITGGAAPPSPDRDLDAYISRKYGKRR